MRSNGIASAILVSLLAATVGCRTATVNDSVLPRLAGAEPQAQIEFWHAVADKPLVSNDEALHGLMLYLDGRDSTAGYDDRVQMLKSRGLLPAKFDEPASAALTRGTLALALVRELNIDGGVTMRIFRDSPRYATRELEFRGIYPPSSPQQVFTGAEFVGVIGKVQDYRAGDPSNVPASVMPGEMRAAHTAPRLPVDQRIALARREYERSHGHVPLAAAAESYFSTMGAALLTLQPAATAPATTAPATTAGSVRIVVTAVEGGASVRENESSAWKPAVVGMELTEAAEFRTGPRGTVQFSIPPDQTVSVDRLTTLKVLRVLREGNRAATDLGIKYGRTRYDLEGGGIEHQSTLRSPNATLAVRGTKVSLFDQPPFTPQAVSLTGRAEFRGFRRQAIAFGGPGQGRTQVSADADNPAEVALADAVVDPSLAGARSDAEAAIVNTVLSRGANVTVDRETGIRIVRGGIPPTTAELATNFPGRLNFIMHWNSDTDVNLGVSTPATPTSPGGEFVYPASGLDISASGQGKTAFDHRGGPNGGVEIVSWQDGFVTGSYGIGGFNVGPNPTTAVIEAFLDGQPVQLFDGQTVANFVVVDIAPQTSGIALASVGSPFPFGSLPGGVLTSSAGKHALSKTTANVRLTVARPAAAKPQAAKPAKKR